jgi:NADPH:quinone reductase-like Zn-dependent oxidoreductase
LQEYDVLIQSYPHILSCDVATAVGSDVKNFRKDDREIGQLDGMGSQKWTNGAFQLYGATTANLVSKLLTNISCNEGAVLPLEISTAAGLFFQKNTLALPYPRASPKPTSKVLLVWGGSSRVGSCAIQLAKAAGYDIATTASSHTHDYDTDQGAKYVFDHAKNTVVEVVVSGLKGKEIAGALNAISSEDTLKKDRQIMSQLGGNKFLSTVLPPHVIVPDVLPRDVKIGRGKTCLIGLRG